MDSLKSLWQTVAYNPRVVYYTTLWEERQVTLSVARVVIALYFVNLGGTALEVLLYGVEGSPIVSLAVLVCAVLLLFNRLTFATSIVLLLKAGWDTLEISGHQISEWLDGRPFYVNELMVKMFSVFGAMCLLLAKDGYFKALRSSSGIAGMLLAGPTAREHTVGRSLVLLLARAAISTLFLFVGISELSRALAPPVVHGNHVHKPVEGDGHSNLWPKVVEFTLAIPLAVGFQTLIVSRAIALTLFLEAFTYWRFWESVLGIGYTLHARQHFAVNIAVAGGLLLLQEMGAGKFSVDAMLEKKKQ